MELSRMQEEALLALNNSDRLLYETEILDILNCDRPKEWNFISQPALNQTLKRMVDKQLIEVAYVDRENYNRKYYQLLDQGLLSLRQAKENRERLENFC